ncbi:Ribonuclease G [Candidatus Syntrophocurvum alkaliphilum]|uniref:Ribonuclease G n=1 Tax=Candidatus Syntrophocurvum alkaliphilum TaxID=2293317 RepID=A0A6I6DFZ6_9FIRM|nr:Rne/Rng family ribonuclease [Candidatus Syntrophocurvum alkaliphilum]QGU00037.1 Ribonuclease G [Candidatus Syntrophocurvum alkaliphilum]
MLRDIIAEIYPWETRVAILEDERVVEVFWANPNENVGNIYKGKVKDILPGLSCAFVDIGLSKNAFLYFGDLPGPQKGPASIKSGQDVLVQVKKEPFSEKGARVTGQITIPGHLIVLLPYQNEVSISRKITNNERRNNLRNLIEEKKPENVGVILRTACLEADDDEIIEELNDLLDEWQEIYIRFNKNKSPNLIYEDIDVIERTLRDYLDGNLRKIIINNLKLKEKINKKLHSKINPYEFIVHYDEGDLFEKYSLEKDIRRALRRKVWLKNGGFLIFDDTEAMTVIDVNSGKYTGKNDFEETVYKLNLEAAVEIPRQLRLRSIGGIILIDFIDMKNKDNENEILYVLKKELEKDKAHTRVIGMTGLGFLEMTRKKSRYGVSEFFTDDCITCHGRGKTINLFALVCEVKRKLANMHYVENDEIVCEGNEQLVQNIQNDEKNLEYIQKKTGKVIKFKVNEDLSISDYNIYTQ